MFKLTEQKLKLPVELWNIIWAYYGSKKYLLRLISRLNMDYNKIHINLRVSTRPGMNELNLRINELRDSIIEVQTSLLMTYWNAYAKLARRNDLFQNHTDRYTNTLTHELLLGELDKNYKKENGNFAVTMVYKSKNTDRFSDLKIVLCPACRTKLATSTNHSYNNYEYCKVPIFHRTYESCYICFPALQ